MANPAVRYTHGLIQPVRPLEAPDFEDILVSAIDQNADMESRNMLRYYDYGIRQWVRSFAIFGGEQGGNPIPCFKASPLRAFSTYRQLLAAQELEQGVPANQRVFGSDGQLELAKFPLPFANFTRGDVLPRPNQNNQNFPWRNLAFIDETHKRRTAYTRYPKPVKIPYQIDFFCRYENHMNHIIHRVHEQFDGPLAYWTVGMPFRQEENFLMPMLFQGLADNSDLETDQDRLLRQTLSIEVEGWIFFDIKEAPTYQTRVTDVVLKDGDQETLVTSVTVKQVPEAPLSSAEVAALPSKPPVAFAPPGGT